MHKISQKNREKNMKIHKIVKNMQENAWETRFLHENEYKMHKYMSENTEMQKNNDFTCKNTSFCMQKYMKNGQFLTKKIQKIYKIDQKDRKNAIIVSVFNDF